MSADSYHTQLDHSLGLQKPLLIIGQIALREKLPIVEKSRQGSMIERSVPETGKIRLSHVVERDLEGFSGVGTIRYGAGQRPVFLERSRRSDVV